MHHNGTRMLVTDLDILDRHLAAVGTLVEE